MGGDYQLSGVPRMHERPIGDLVDALRGWGARIDYLGQEGYPPLRLGRGRVQADTVRVQGAVSSQFLTALLMAAPIEAGASGRPVTIEVIGELISKPYIEITLNLMARYGVTVRRDGWRAFTIEGGARYRSPGRIAVEGDASTASYFLALGVLGGGPVRVTGVGENSIQATSPSPTPWPTWGPRSPGAPIGSKPAARRWPRAGGSSVRRRFQPDSRRGHDCRGHGAVCRRALPPAQYRQLARQGNRSYPRDADRTG